MTRLLDDILMVGKLEAGQHRLNLTPINLNALCHAAIDDVRSSGLKQHEIVFMDEGMCAPIQMDARLVMQILNNLLSNAVKYSPEGGVVRVDLNC